MVSISKQSGLKETTLEDLSSSSLGTKVTSIWGRVIKGKDTMNLTLRYTPVNYLIETVLEKISVFLTILFFTKEKNLSFSSSD